ncbi:protein of unknown function DUF1486 [Gemmatirosa kalamazoonensis]|uniref:SnoaL-like domain-containing protein n=1 Tax=Gemmatirosa kalamazoonensis TaxID=861299 RepID=W0RIH9_9BACT|nr:ester cyclase [Gemmatirosa kalamazoonensis]AHG89193.1 protein of unknown function DUF1486 [Gemmatirosa kalamazoonensis]
MSSTATQAPSALYATADVDATVSELYTVFNRRDFGALQRLVPDDATLTIMPTGETVRGAAGVEQFMRGWVDAFSDGHIEIDTLAQGGDIVVCEFHGIGTHSGTLRTPVGDIAATGRPVNVPFCDVIQLRDGRIAAMRTYFDAATFARQLQG